MATTNGKRRYGLVDLVEAVSWAWRPVVGAVQAETGLTPRQIVGGLLRAGAGLLWRAADTVAPIATPAVLIVTPAAEPVAEVRPAEVTKAKAKRPASVKPKAAPKAKPAAKKPTPKAKPVRAAARVTKPKAKPKAAPKPRAAKPKAKA